VRSAEAFSSMQTLNAHFGLGQDTQIDSISICWPSGVVDIIYNPAINSHLVITEGSTVGINDSERNDFENANLYPNPANENVTLKYVSLDGGNHQISITDINGKLIFVQDITVKKGNNEQQISLSGMNAGIYLVTISDESGNTQHMKLIKN
jgi:hypothetical protein